MQAFKYNILLTMLFIVTSAVATAQNRVQIQGTVIDQATLKPIQDATVAIGHQAVATDAEGKYILTGVNKNITRLKFSHVGYAPKWLKVNLTQRKEYTLNVKLSEANSTLNEVVVTGTRTEKKLGNTPILTKVITETDISEIGCVTAFDALQNIMPGIQFSPDSHGSNMTIQGLDNDYVLVLVDGERLVGETRGNVNLDRIVASDIKQIEIVSGASSVLYGSNAIGGVINIITKDATKPIEGTVITRISKFNTWNTILSGGLKNDQFSLKINGFRNSSDGYDLTPETPEYFTANPYADYSGSLKARYAPNKKIHLSTHATYFRHESLNPEKSLKVTHGLNENIAWGAKVGYSFSDKHQLLFSINTDKYNAYSVFEKMNDSTAKKTDYRYTTLLLTDNYQLNKKWQFVTGAEWNMENLYSHDLFGTTNTEKRKKTQDVNLFTQVDWQPIQNIELIGGVRYTRHATFGNHLTPKLSAMYRVGAFKFRGTAALGYKSPSLKELYYNFDHQGMFWIYGNKELKPENARYFSLSAEYTKGMFNISINAYNNLIYDKIDMMTTINKTTDKMEIHHYNINEAHLKGIESYLNWQFLSHFKVKAGYAFTDAVDKSTGLQITGNSKHTATTAFTFFTKNIRYPFSATISGRFASPRLYQTSSEDKSGTTILQEVKSEPYSIWNFTYVQQVPLYRNIKADLQVGVNNIFDYSNLEKSAVINPGRTFWGGVSVNF